MKKWILLAGAVLVLAQPAAGQKDFPTLGREVETLVRERFYDTARGERWAKENAGYAQGITDAEAFRRDTGSRLAELGASHTAYYPQDDLGYRDLLSIFEPVLQRSAEGEGLGLAVTERDGGWFVVLVFQRSGRAPLVGERTAGAVLAGQPFLLSDGSLLFLAVFDVLVDGERLEGVGVKPDVPVADDLPYAEGHDPQLERALSIAAERVKAR